MSGTWVCDGCMRRVHHHEVAVWADYEHILCRECAPVDPPEQLTIHDALPPPDGDRSGEAYEAVFDYDRLNRQARDVWRVMSDHRWHTLAEVAGITGHPQASVSARLRDLRKPRFGGHTVDRERVPFADGLFEYRLVPAAEAAARRESRLA